jgi:formate hydrogenlyase transcriptional activator
MCLRLIVAAAPGPCMIVDPALDQVIAGNAPAAAMFGLDSVEGERFSRLHPGMVARIIVFADEVAAFGAAWTHELIGRRADGGSVELEYEARAIETELGLLLAFHAHDLTDRAQRMIDTEVETYTREGILAWKRAERMFRETERVNELILSAAGDGIYGVDIKGRTTFLNPTAERMLGWNAADLIGRDIHPVIHHTRPDGSHYPGHECPIYNAFRHARVNRVDDEHFWRKDGRPIRVEYTSTPIIDSGHVSGAVVVFRDITERIENERRLRDALAEVDTLKERLEQENAYLREEIGDVRQHADIIGTSAATRRLLEQIALVAPTDANVLITGESGTGKELAAQAIHKESARTRGPLIRVNCAAIPRELFEAEFFGHAKGAFTGAGKERLGRFELANGGTLFLDEVGEIPLELQGKLLRVIQERSFERIGESRSRALNIRIVAATNRDLAAEVQAGRFREDLYFRLNVFPLHCTPLRERSEDIPQLAAHFLRQVVRRLNVGQPILTKASVAQLVAYDWPGNARELQNVIERAAILSRGGKLAFDLRLRRAAERRSGASQPVELVPLARIKEIELENIRAALRASGGRVSGAGGAAERLGVNPNTRPAV